jgi:hypothetical protein
MADDEKLSWLRPNRKPEPNLIHCTVPRPTSVKVGIAPYWVILSAKLALRRESLLIPPLLNWHSPEDWCPCLAGVRSELG